MALKRLISAVKERLASNARLPKVTLLLRGSPMIMRHQNLSKCPGGRAVWNGHVVNVDGFKDGAYHVVDPVFGARWINAGTFENAFNVTGMAVAVR